MADLGDIIARAATNAALAQSEQLTGIPFFQQAQARQERESVRQDQLSANQSRLRAAMNTGLVTAQDVDAAGGREALVKDTGFDKIFDGLLESNRRRISQEESDEAQMLQARVGAAQAGVTLTGGESREEILLMTANEVQKRDERDRQETLLTQRHTAVSTLLEDLRQNPSPSDQEIAAAQDAVRVFESQAAEHGKLGESLVVALQAGVQATVRGVSQNRAVDQGVQGVRTGSVAALANTPPEHRGAVRNNAEVAEAMNSRQRTLTELQKISSLDSAVKDELKKVEGMSELVSLMENIREASDGGAVTVDTLLNLNEKGGVELLDRLATADTSSLAGNIERAKVRGTQLPQKKAAFQGQVENTLDALPKDGPTAKLVNEWAGQQEVKMLFREDGTPYADFDPAAPTFSTVVDRFLNDESISVQERYMVANRLGTGGAGTVAKVQDTGKYVTTANALFNRLSRSEQINLDIETTDENIGQVTDRLVKSLEKRGKGFEYGAQRQDAVEAITGLPPLSKVVERREALKKEAQDETDPVKQGLLQRKLKALDEDVVRTQHLESFFDDTTAAMVAVYTEEKGQAVLDGILGRLGVNTGLDAATVPGKQDFLDAWGDAETYQEKREAVLFFMATSYEKEGVDVKTAAGNFMQMLETAEDSVEQNFPTTTRYAGGALERTEADTKGVRRQLSTTLKRAGVGVEIPKKLDEEALSALIVLNSVNRG